MTSRSSAGGAAAAGGVDYQGLVGAYVAVRVLAESALSPLWDLPESVTFTGLWAESGASVDDVLVTTSVRGLVFVQAKRTVAMSDRIDSTIGAAFAQFVKLYRESGSVAFPATNEKRALDRGRDRIVLVTSGTTGPLDDFTAVLKRVREMPMVPRPRDCATTDGEREALARGIRLVRRCWRQDGGSAPSWNEMLPFLQLLRITTLRLEAGELDEDAAKYWLRDRILVRANEAEAAWKLFKDKAIGLAKRKSGVDRRELQTTLTNADVPLRALRSYRDDIERLVGHTRTNLRALLRFSRIRYNGIDVTIRREYEAILKQEAESESLVVIGEAGCGKSGLLAVFAEQARADGRDVVMLNAGELGAESLGQLRVELNLERELVEILENWHGEGAGFLVIDALDSARDDRTAGALRRLIERVQQLEGRWRVIATIRKFDLKNGKHWQQVMPGNGIRPHFDPAFDDVRHLSIGVLSSADIDQLKGSAPDLHAMVQSAPPAVAELLRVPFNLMLANELRLAGGENDLKAVKTQLGLLDKYWDRRVDGSLVERGRHETLLRDVTETMLHARRVYLPISSIAPSDALETLLSRSVLMDHGARLQYSHHILFDYAIERLLLRPNADTTIARLENDRDLPIAAGPSVKYWLEGVWERDATRAEFWRLAFQLVLSTAPAIAKIVAGTVAADKTNITDDCDGLIAAIASDGGEKIFMFVADAVTANLQRVTSQRPCPWFAILERLAPLATQFVFHRGTVLLHSLLDTITDPSAQEVAAAGNFARAALRRAWSVPSRNRSFVVTCLRAVSRTFQSDTASSEALLRRALATEHVNEYGHEELRWLADFALEFVAAPDFLVDLYEATFRATASADEQTTISNSQILGLTSNKQQDLDGARYQLGKRFGDIATKHLAIAVTIAIRVANQYVALHGVVRSKAGPAVEFSIAGETAQFVPEGYVRRRGARDEELELVQEVAQQLSRIATDPPRQQELLKHIGYIARNNRTALFWNELIDTAEHAAELFLALRETLFAPVVLSLFSKGVIASLRKHQARLSPDDRARIESAALAVRDSGYGDVTAFQLLTALSADTLGAAARAWCGQIEEVRKQAASQRPVTPPEEDEEDEEEDEEDSSSLYVLSESGMSVDELRAEANKTARRRAKELRARVVGLTDTAPTATLDAIEKELRALEDYLGKEAVHPLQVSLTWGAIAEAATALAKRRVNSVADLLVTASTRPEPSYSEEQESQFARSPGWGGGQSRMEAAPGLMALASRTNNAAVLAAIENLSKDRVSSVKFEIGRNLPEIASRHNELYWTLLDQLSQDANPSVVAWLELGHALSVDAERGLQIILRAFDKWRRHTDERASLVRELFNLILWHWLRTEHPAAKKIVDNVRQDPIGNADLLSHAVMYLRNVMTEPRNPARSDPDIDLLRRRSIAFVTRVTAVALAAFNDLSKCVSPNDTDREQFRQVAKLLINVTQEIYFASLAYDEENEAKKGKPDPKVRVRFFEESKQLLRDLTTVGVAGSAHYLIQTLVSFIDLVDPVEVFLLIADAVRVGRKGGYQYETLAVKEIVAIVERYLADFRVIFMDNADCRAGLRDILDTFVEAGWPETHRLVYSLDSIFR